MYLLILFAFVAGFVTVLSPCILPVLPIVLSGSTIGDKKYPFGVVVGFILSFTFFTLFLTTLVGLTGVSPDFLRYVSVAIIFLFGLVLVVPKLTLYFEILVSKFQSNATPTNNEEQNRSSFGGGFVVGISLGLVWTPCVGPILASVIALALSGAVTGSAVVITLAYALGTAIPMLAIMYGGRSLLARVPWLYGNLAKIQKAFGVLLLVLAVAIVFNLDRQFQTYILKTFPNYGTGLVQFEDNEKVFDAIDATFDKSADMDDMGKPLFDISGEAIESLFPSAPELVGTGKWFNSDPLTLKSLRGKVVLIDFWTYSCINCIRTLPYLQAWHEEYADDGLVIIGVHTPEFEFEKDASNVAEAIEDFGLTYAVVQDNDFKTWRAYENRYWPAKYFIDVNGKVRSTHFGEGDYEESEAMIKELLSETGADVSDGSVDVEAYDIYSRTPELYLGYERIKNFVSPEQINPVEAAGYTLPSDIENNEFAYLGGWAISGEKSLPQKNSELHLNFESKEVYLVMNNLNSKNGEVEVYVDGELVSDFAGEDAVDGVVTIDKDRLYHLVSLNKPGRHMLKLKFLDDNTEAYAFTFG